MAQGIVVSGLEFFAGSGTCAHKARPQLLLVFMSTGSAIAALVIGTKTNQKLDLGRRCIIMLAELEAIPVLSPSRSRISSKSLSTPHA